ncbi:cytoplasmic dynein 2 intermediate chain 1-like [Clavelina lepadiformis]|uniref:cytoplasmic dynein 2 intermediate chain 1-like n=1 Tax=Clavelina lepadiformis TaxID=159417 RepID=UPI0040430386
MSEKRHRRKDETWTSKELSAALHGSKDKRDKTKRSENIDFSDNRRSERKSSRKSDSRVEEETARGNRKSSGTERKFHDEKGEHHESRRDAKSENHRRRDRDDGRDDERRREKRKEGKEIREESGRDEKRHHRREEGRDRRHDEDDKRRDRGKDHRDKEERRSRRKTENEVDHRERKHKERVHDEKRDRRSARNEEDYDVERQRKKEEKRRRREEEEKVAEKERRHHKRDRDDRDGRHKKRSENEKESSSKRKDSEQKKRHPKPVLTPEDDYNYDDEEFEDYEDDFEDDASEKDSAAGGGNPEVDDVIRAIQRENERISSARTLSAKSDTYTSSTPTEADSVSSARVMSTNINFSSSRQHSTNYKARKKMITRRNDLLTLIQLDVMTFDLFDLPPVTEYNFYIKNFGGQNARQVSTQCNDDALEVDTQTDETEVVEKWTQHPQDGASATGGSSQDQGANNALNFLSMMRDSSLQFGKFMSYASNVIESSFMEATVWRGNKSDERSVLSCCDSCIKFNTNFSYLQGRHILHATFGDGLMAISFSPSQLVSTRIDQKGLITVWKASNTEQPDKILVCDALPITTCFLPKNNHLLFAGANDGSVLVYNLMEASSMHQCIEIERGKVTALRSPTYSTANVSDVHASPVISLRSAGNQNSNQIFSLEESAKLCVWIVVDISSDVDDDVNLVPHGRVKLVKSLKLDVTSSRSSSELGSRATCALCPDSDIFYVGYETGHVISWTRDRKLKTYRSHGAGAATFLSVSALNTSLILTSYADGSLALFDVKQEYPVMTWSLDGGSLLFCDWSNCRSSVFFALDSTNQFHVWDLMASDSAPVVSDKFQEKTSRFCVDVSTDQSTSLMVTYDSCAFEVHRLSSHFTDSVSSNEAEQMTSLVTSFS